VHAERLIMIEASAIPAPRKQLDLSILNRIA